MKNELIKFTDAVIFKESDNETVVLSFEHDDIIIVRHQLQRLIPLIQSGSHRLALLEQLNMSGKPQEQHQLDLLLNLFASRNMLNDYSVLMPSAETLFQWPNLGEIEVKTFEYQEVYAQKADEI